MPVVYIAQKPVCILLQSSLSAVRYCSEVICNSRKSGLFCVTFIIMWISTLLRKKIMLKLSLPCGRIPISTGVIVLMNVLVIPQKLLRHVEENFSAAWDHNITGDQFTHCFCLTKVKKKVWSTKHWK